MKKIILIWVGICAMLLDAAAQAPILNYKQLNAQASREYRSPIRPGYEGRNPYWNAYSIRFLYAPAFDFATIEGAKDYRYTATVNGKDYSFTAKLPNLSLSPIWDKMPAGEVVLKVEALDAKGNSLGTAGERSFLRDHPFKGPYHEKVRNYKEAALAALQYIHRIPATLAWEHNTEPDMSFPLNTYPCKTVSAVIRSELMLSKVSEKQAEQAIAIAKNAGNFLMEASEPADATLAYFPPTYYKGEYASAKDINKGKTMSMEASKAAMALLDLYDHTKDEKYMKHVIGMLNTYKRLQREDGSIPIKLYVATGEPVNEVNASLHPLLYVLKRLHEQYGMDEYESMRKSAENWMETKAYDKFEMVGQFEDVPVEGVKPYQNLTHWTGVPYITYALESGRRDPEMIALARDVINFGEDQFVIWQGSLNADGIHEKFYPGVWEQNEYRVPIDDSAANMATAWLALYKATGDKLAFAKAKALMDQMTIVQCSINGMIPTVWGTDYSERPSRHVWLSCSLISIQTLLEFSEFVGE